MIQCSRCLFYNVYPDKIPRCMRMYIQKLNSVVYFEHPDELRKNEKMCGKDAKWYIGKQDQIILPMDSKKPCYDK